MEKFPVNNIEIKEKPAVVYHGSSSSDLEELHPKAERFRDKKEGPVIFGTVDKEFASMFLGPRPDDSWSAKGRLKGVYYIIIGNEERYRREDKGGVIYELSGEEFDYNKNLGIKTEWVTKKPVTPLSKQQYSSALNAMIESGVQVYFVDRGTLDKFKEAVEHDSDHGQSILESLKSENQKIGKNVKSFKSKD